MALVFSFTAFKNNIQCTLSMTALLWHHINVLCTSCLKKHIMFKKQHIGNSVKNKPILIIFGTQTSEEILIVIMNLSTTPEKCHCTNLWNAQRLVHLTDLLKVRCIPRALKMINTVFVPDHFVITWDGLVKNQLNAQRTCPVAATNTQDHSVYHLRITILLLSRYCSYILQGGGKICNLLVWRFLRILIIKITEFVNWFIFGVIKKINF